MKSKKQTTTVRRLKRARVESSVDRPGPLPVVAPLFEPIPAEVVDLTTGPFERNFPELARRRERRGD